MKLKELITVLIKGLFAGIAIALGGLLFIRTKAAVGNESVLPAFLFSIGLLLICSFGFFLYTGKICYLGDKIACKEGRKYALHLILGLIGNYIGAACCGIIFSYVLEVPTFMNSIIEVKLGYNVIENLIVGFFCGIMVYLAVEGFAKIENAIGKYIVLIFCVGGFIACGFEHCIANIFYFSFARNFSLDSFIAIGLVLIGNSIGGMLIPLVRRVLHE